MTKAKPEPTTPEETPGSEVVKVDPQTGEIAPGEETVREGDAISNYLAQGQEDAWDDSPEAAYRRIIEQVLSAQTPEEVLTPVEAMGVKELVGVPLTLFGFGHHESEFEAGSPVYFSMEVIREDTGEKLVANTGHQRMMAQLLRLAQLGAFPCKVVVREGRRPTRYGSMPLRLEMP